MVNWIESAPEPQRLVLAWQAPDHLGVRHRWAVGLLERGSHPADCGLIYFQEPGEIAAWNPRRSIEELFALGYQGYPAFSLRKREHEDVLPAFMRRLPPRGRSDFDEYRRQFRLRPSQAISDFALLGQTEAKLPSDGFSVVDPLDGTLSHCDLMLEIAGYRYYPARAGVAVGNAVTVQPEPDNEHDPAAVAVRVRGEKVGNINRLQTAAFHQWLSERTVTAVIERLNGRPEKPRAFIFVRVRPAG